MRWWTVCERHMPPNRCRTVRPSLQRRPRQTLAPVDALTDCLTRCLGELSPDDAAIVRACDLDGQTVQRALREAHGLSLPAAKSRLLRARQRLRERLTTACQVRFDADGSVAGHVPRPPVSSG